MIKVENLSKNYGPYAALKKVDFSISQGKVVGFLGPNGAGKTTTLKILMGLMRPTSGRVFIDGQNISQHRLEVQTKVGYLPDVAPLYDDMTVTEYLSFVCALKKVDQLKIKNLVDEILIKTHLTDVAHRMNGKLSKGFRQRVGLAQALVAKPKVVILDEPTSGFDPQQISEFKHLIKSLEGQTTVLLSSHQLADVESICSDVIVLHRGEVVTSGSFTDIQKKWKQNQQLKIQVDRSAQDWKTELLKISGVVMVHLDSQGTTVFIDHGAHEITNEVLQSAIQQGLRILNVEQQKQSLEELFLDLTKPQEIQL